METLLFDLDDTLIIEWKSAEESFIETISQIDTSIGIDKFLKTITEKAKELWHKLPTIDFSQKIGISSWEALWADFDGDDIHYKQLKDLSAVYRYETWNQTLIQLNINNPEVALRLSNDFKRIRNLKHNLFPETLETLNNLKGLYKLGLITNGAPDLQWKKINGSNIKHYFDCIVISGELGFAKPDERIFLTAIDSLKATKSKTIMIGDTLKSDIKGAQNSGIKTIWINRNKSISEYIMPDYEIANLSDIFRIIT